jgi:hypothetical protein
MVRWRSSRWVWLNVVGWGVRMCVGERGMRGVEGGREEACGGQRQSIRSRRVDPRYNPMYYVKSFS